MNFPSIDIALVAWPNHIARWTAFRKTIASLHEFVRADGFRINYVCSSESVGDPKHVWYGPKLEKLCERENIRFQFRRGPPGLGENMNAALRMCTSEFILLVQDDRPPIKPLDLGPSVRYLIANPDIAMIRYDWPIGHNPITKIVRTTLITLPDGWRQIDIDSPWPYGDEPHLRHRSFADRFGWYEEGGTHGRSENAMKAHLKAANARIMAADDHYFGHNCPLIPAVVDDVRPQGKNR